jgi:hypothetical protein
MSDFTKIVVIVLAVLLYLHWRKVKTALVTGGASAPGNPVASTSTMGCPTARRGPGNVNFRETWGTWE